MSYKIHLMIIMLSIIPSVAFSASTQANVEVMRVNFSTALRVLQAEQEGVEALDSSLEGAAKVLELLVLLPEAAETGLEVLDAAATARLQGNLPLAQNLEGAARDAHDVLQWLFSKTGCLKSEQQLK